MVACTEPLWYWTPHLTPRSWRTRWGSPATSTWCAATSWKRCKRWSAPPGEKRGVHAADPTDLSSHYPHHPHQMHCFHCLFFLARLRDSDLSHVPTQGWCPTGRWASRPWNATNAPSPKLPGQAAQLSGQTRGRRQFAAKEGRQGGEKKFITRVLLPLWLHNVCTRLVPFVQRSKREVQKIIILLFKCDKMCFFFFFLAANGVQPESTQRPGHQLPRQLRLPAPGGPRPDPAQNRGKPDSGIRQHRGL